MPYTVRKSGSKHCVYKKDGGKKVGCTSGSPKKYLAALHVNEIGNSELPEKVDISKQLQMIERYRASLDTTDGVAYNRMVSKIGDIEDEIRGIVEPIMMQYLDVCDFEGAKWFVGKSFGKVDTSLKVLLFRSILVAQQQNKCKQVGESIIGMSLSRIAKDILHNTKKYMK